MQAETRSKFASSYHDMTTELSTCWIPVTDPIPEIYTQLFVRDSLGSMSPRWRAIPEVQRQVINSYASYHTIPPESMVDFWSTYVECLLCCNGFEENANPEFKAWAFGRMCKFVLMSKKAIP